NLSHRAEQKRKPPVSSTSKYTVRHASQDFYGSPTPTLILPGVPRQTQKNDSKSTP
ncbi:hypothetical protein VNI00_011048, partial [Paramarasmius palmivorus]